MTTVHLYAPAPTTRWRGIAHCPVCRARRRYVGRAYEWYGPTVTCLGCGDTWHSGELSQRPAERGWRQRAIERARQLWRDIGEKP